MVVRVLPTPPGPVTVTSRTSHGARAPERARPLVLCPQTTFAVPAWHWVRSGARSARGRDWAVLPAMTPETRCVTSPGTSLEYEATTRVMKTWSSII